jgi:thiamine biosynthesis protein ThiS
MTITVNGKEEQTEDGLTIIALLDLLQLDASRVAVERNREIVAREDFAHTALEHQDVIELVQFVGGG